MLNRHALKVLILFAIIELFMVRIGFRALVLYEIPFVVQLIIPLVLYGLAGYFTARVGGSGTLGGGLIALLDSVLVLILYRNQLYASDIVSVISVIVLITLVIILVTAIGLGLGWFGGWFWRRSQRSVVPPETPTEKS